MTQGERIEVLTIDEPEDGLSPECWEIVLKPTSFIGYWHVVDDDTARFIEEKG